MITLVRAQATTHWEAAGRLVAEYAASLEIDLSFQSFADELCDLPAHYGPPDGAFLLALEDGLPVGCGGVRPFATGTCEMKRLYVRPAAQGRGVGRALAAALIEQARTIGYREILLDTLPTMRGAQALYRSLGFEEIEGYRFNPVEGTRFYRRPL